jgi:cell division protease FtsH
MRINGNRKWLLFGALALAAVAVLLLATLRDSTEPERTDLTMLLGEIQRGNVSEITVSSSSRTLDVVMIDGSERRSAMQPEQSLTGLLSDAGIPSSDWPPIYVESSGSTFGESSQFMLRVALLVVIFVAVILVMRRMMPGAFGGTGRKNRFTPIPPGQSMVTFDDVAGAAEIKSEVSDIVDFLREPERFRSVGAQIPHGLLLVGPPGTGKTLLAKALAGEANANFFSVSGAEFVELYVGVGASRVRELFRKAKDSQPAIIFIDEIDAIGRRRGRADNSSEYDQTLNQILVEMDGFENRSNIVVIAATNRADVLDSALLRPGRFDRKVFVELPDREARRAIMAVHCKGKPIAGDVNLDEIAARTSGLTGADLANVVNEAAIQAGRVGETIITMANFAEALERTLAGPARTGRRYGEHERRVVAYHEAGHALVTYLLPHADKVRKVSIVARGQAGGFTMITPEEDRGLWTRTQLEQRLAGLLAGMAAEQIVFDEVTTGSSNDLEQATSIAGSMVQRYGMGRTFGLLSAGSGNGQLPPFSQQSTFAAEQEALQIVSDAHQMALDVIEHHRDDLERLAQRLLDVETVEGDELQHLITGTPDAIEISNRGADRHGRRRTKELDVGPPVHAPVVTRRGPVRRVLGSAAAALALIGRFYQRETPQEAPTERTRARPMKAR